MKTAKQLQDIYIKSTIHNYKQDQQLTVSKQGILVPVYPMLCVAFCNYVKANVYRNNTVAERLCKWANVEYSSDSKILEQRIIKNISFIKANFIIKKETKEVNRRILSYFEKYRIELNNELAKIN